MAGVSPCWLPAPVAGCPRHCPTCTGLPRAPRLRAAHLHPLASSSNGAGPVVNGGAATEQRPSPPTHTWKASGGDEPSPRETPEEGGWLEQAAARIADANGGNLYATGPPAAPGSSRRAASPEAASASAASSADPEKGRSADAVPRADVSQRDSAPATPTGTGLQSNGAPASGAKAAKAGGQPVSDAPHATAGEVQPWGRTVAQALAAGEQTRRRHDEASARICPHPPALLPPARGARTWRRAPTKCCLCHAPPLTVRQHVMTMAAYCGQLQWQKRARQT